MTNSGLKSFGIRVTDKPGDLSKSRISGFHLRKHGAICPHLVFCQICSSFEFLFLVSTVQTDYILLNAVFPHLQTCQRAFFTQQPTMCVGKSRISTSSAHFEFWYVETRDATLMCFHTQALYNQRREEGAQLFWFCIISFCLRSLSAHSRVNSKLPQRLIHILRACCGKGSDAKVNRWN